MRKLLDQWFYLIVNEHLNLYTVDSVFGFVCRRQAAELLVIVGKLRLKQMEHHGDFYLLRAEFTSVSIGSHGTGPPNGDQEGHSS